MSATNYVDPEETRPVTIGPCSCPPVGGKRPHETDTADLVVRFGYGELGRIRQTARIGGQEASYQVMILIGVKRWNLVKPDGSVREINALEVGRLPESIVTRLLEDDMLGAAFEDDPLPNRSGDPSPSGSPESDTPTQTTPTPSSSTST